MIILKKSKYKHKDPAKRKNEYITKSQRSEHCSECQRAKYSRASYYNCEICGNVVNSGWCKQFKSKKSKIEKCRNKECSFCYNRWDDGCLQSHKPEDCINHSKNSE